MSLLNQLTPDVIAGLVKSNPALVLNVLQKFDTFKYFGNALDVDRQIFLSNNLHCVNSFLISEDGKEYVCILVDAFKDFAEKEKQKQPSL